MTIVISLVTPQLYLAKLLLHYFIYSELAF